MAESDTRKVAVKASVGKTLPPLQVRYYRRMRPGRVYPVHICWKTAERGVAGKEVTLKLNLPGVHVVPAEHTLKPTDPEDEVTFYATPLAKGKLTGSVLQVWYQGIKVQDMPLPCKVTSQFWSWFFLFMAFLLPAFLLHYCKYHPYQRDLLPPKESLERLLRENLPDKDRMIEAFPDYDEWITAAGNWQEESFIKEIGSTYAALIDVCKAYPVALGTCLTFLLLALISVWWHRAKRKRRLGEPIGIPTTAL